MYDSLKRHFQQVLPFTEEELSAVDQYFTEHIFAKKAMLLEAPHPCKYLFFIVKGCVRHFHTKDDGNEKTCDISLENQWTTACMSFNSGCPSNLSLQALEETTVYRISKEDLISLYAEHHNFETFGRLMAEQILQRATDTAMYLAADKPEECFEHLLHSRPELFLRVPQKYIANLLGISPESLSRLQKRMYSKKS